MNKTNYAYNESKLPIPGTRSEAVFTVFAPMCACLFVGYGPGYDDIIVHGDLEAPKFIAYYTK